MKVVRKQHFLEGGRSCEDTNDGGRASERRGVSFAAPFYGHLPTPSLTEHRPNLIASDSIKLSFPREPFSLLLSIRNRVLPSRRSLSFPARSSSLPEFARKREILDLLYDTKLTTIEIQKGKEREREGERREIRAREKRVPFDSIRPPRFHLRVLPEKRERKRGEREVSGRLRE